MNKKRGLGEDIVEERNGRKNKLKKRKAIK